MGSHGNAVPLQSQLRVTLLRRKSLSSSRPTPTDWGTPPYVLPAPAPPDPSGSENTAGPQCGRQTSQLWASVSRGRGSALLPARTAQACGERATQS